MIPSKRWGGAPGASFNVVMSSAFPSQSPSDTFGGVKCHQTGCALGAGSPCAREDTPPGKLPGYIFTERTKRI